MATKIIDAIARIQLRTAQGLYAGGYAGVTVEGSIDTANGVRIAIESGKTVIAGARQTSEEYTLTLTQQTFDRKQFELALGEVGEVSTTIIRPVIKEGNVPATAAYTIADTELLTADLDTLLVAMYEEGAWNTQNSLEMPVLVAPDPVVDGSVLAANQLLTFDSAQAGAPVVWSYLKTESNKWSAGYESEFQLLTEFAFSCDFLIGSDRYSFVAPQISKTSPFAFATDDISEVEHTFTIGTAAGRRSPYYIVKV